MKRVPFNYDFLKKVDGMTIEAFLQEFEQEQLDGLIETNFLYIFNGKVALAQHGSEMVNFVERRKELGLDY